MSDKMSDKKFIAIILAIAICLTNICLGITPNMADISVSAETYSDTMQYGDYLYYKQVDKDRDGTYDYIIITDCDTYVKTVDIPSEINGLPVMSIGERAFYECSGLTSITIPNSVTSIGSSTFELCTSLTSIKIPDSITSIGGFAFSDCSSLTSITIPDSVTSIGAKAFSDCGSLTSIEIPNGVTSIVNSTFEFCKNLTNITIPNSITSIGNNAFYYCISLTSIEMPDSVTSIEQSAFYHCDSLTSIEIPNSVTSIEQSAFSDCTSLTSITIKNPECKIYGSAINNGRYDNSIVYYNGVISGYENSTAQAYAEKYSYEFESLGKNPTVTTEPPTTTTSTIICTTEISTTTTTLISTVLVTSAPPVTTTTTTTTSRPVSTEPQYFTSAVIVTSISLVTRVTHVECTTYVPVTDSFGQYVTSVSEVTSFVAFTSYIILPYTSYVTVTMPQTTTTRTTTSRPVYSIYTYPPASSTTTSTTTTPIVTTTTPYLIKGDVNYDGKTDILDIIEINKSLLPPNRDKYFTDEQKVIGDINADGKVDLYDSIFIAREVLNEIPDDNIDIPYNENISDGEMGIEIGDISGRAGTSVSVPLYIRGIDECVGAELTVDSPSLKIDSLSGGMACKVNGNKATGVFASGDHFSDDIGSVKIDIPYDTEPGEYPINIKVYKMVLDNGEIVSDAIGVSGIVTIGKLTLSETELNLSVGETAALEVLSYEDSVKWLSDDSSIATVKNGIVSAVSAGTTTIYAVAENEILKCKVTVNGNTTVATAVTTDSVTPETSTTTVSTSVTSYAPMTETTTAETASVTDTTLNTTKPITSVATETDKPVTSQSDTTTATYNISLSETEVDLEVGDSVKLIVEYFDGEVKWFSDDTSIATVKDGRITAVSAGTVEIYAMTDAGNLTCIVNVIGAAVIDGDIDGNGKADLYDAIIVCKCMIGAKDVTEEQKKNADVNGDGKIDLYDAIRIAELMIENSKKS